MMDLDKVYKMEAEIWFRESTNEWILEISGVINDTNITARHPFPSDTVVEDIPTLEYLYKKIPLSREGV